MNEIHSYDPETYHATLTHSVYVRLEGSVLRLSKPNRNISRRATHNEPKPDVTYISQKIYDLTDSKVRWLKQTFWSWKERFLLTPLKDEGEINVLSVCARLLSVLLCLMISLTFSDIEHTSRHICLCPTVCSLIGHAQ